MIVLNLFVGVMLTGMDEAKKEQELLEAAERKKSTDLDLKHELVQMDAQLKEMSAKLSENLLVLSKRAEENTAKIETLMDQKKGQGG